MQKLNNAVRVGLIYVAVVVLAGGYPMAAMAETVDGTTTATTETTAPPPSVSEQVPQQEYVPEPAANNDGWAYNPATGKTEPIVMPLTPEESHTDSEGVTQSSEPSATSTLDSTTTATIDTSLNSTATSGNASVDSNTIAGNATSGDAAATATFMNMINSSVSGNNGEFATFVTDVVGDVHGDIMLYPMLLAAMLNTAAAPSESTVNVNNDATINNTINLNATSGDATVQNNTTAGSATTGSADTVANVVNIINSIIAANQSFVGTVNIYGNLDGDILVAPDFLPQLLASNNANPGTPGGSLVVSSDDTQSIINNIDLNAASGNASVTGNTNAGSATSGDAKTNLVLLNLSGHQIVAKDSLLVFVNVLGQWVGIIVDAPAGTSAAALGSGVTSTSTAPDLTINVDNNSQIVNDITLNSQTGDATVANNTNAGNATTGNATASANVANIAGSQLGLSGWFGVLFINVFGSWLGSFGVDTARGNPAAMVGGMGGVNEPPRPMTAQPLQFIADAPNSTKKRVPFSSGNNDTGMSAVDQAGQAPVLEVATAAATEDQKGSAILANDIGNNTPNSGMNSQAQFDILPFIAATFILGLGAVAVKYILALIRSRGAVI